MEQFLEKLESHLTVLETSEQRKIIKRFQKEIEEKIKDGMTEEEAIKSLGTIESIVSEIYEEYHLDKKNLSEKNTVGKSFNNGMRKCANFLSDTCAEIAYYVTHISNQALETFFEVLLKVIVLIIAILFLKVPFLLVENLLHFGLKFLFYPFDVILIKLSSFVIAIIYLLVCISLAIMMFKGYVKKNEKSEEERVDIKDKNKTEKIKSSETARNYAYIMVKVFLYIIFIIPMICITLTLLLLTALALFFVYKGVSMIGLVVIFVGLLFLSIIVTTSITDSLDNRSRSHTLGLIVTVVSLISGTILFADNLMGFDYPKALEKSSFDPYKETTTIELTEESVFYNLNGKISYVLDNSIQDNQVLIELSYYDELYDVIIKSEGNNLWLYTVRDEWEVADLHYLYQNVFNDLANNKIYDYKNLSNLDIVIYVNENTEKLLNTKE